MFVVKYRKFFYILSLSLIVVSIGAMVMIGFNFGIDFKGGTITQVSYATRPAQETVKANIDKLDLGVYSIQPSGEKNYTVRTREITQTEKDSFISSLTTDSTNPAKVENYDSIGPVVGAELKNKAITAVVIVIICIMLFITFAFRKVSKPVASWKFGMATVIALLHDVIIPTGLFVIYTKFTGAEFDILFVSAVLSVLGYSVHDTIVVFDRVREHLRINNEQKNKEDFETTVGKSVKETFGRSINTSLTIFLVLLTLFLIGGSTTKDFAFVLLIGVVVGTYSSIFVASPLLVTFEKMQK